MKVLIIFAICVIGNITAGEIPEDEMKMMTAYKNECIVETGVDTDILEKAEKERKLVSDDKFACFSACMLKKIGFMTEDGKADEDMLSALLSTKLPEDVLNTALKNCKNEVGKDHCETAIKLIKCFIENKATVMV